MPEFILSFHLWMSRVSSQHVLSKMKRCAEKYLLGKFLNFLPQIFGSISQTNWNLLQRRSNRHSALLWLLKAHSSNFSTKSSQWLLLPRNLCVLHHMGVTFNEEELQQFAQLFCKHVIMLLSVHEERLRGRSADCDRHTSYLQVIIFDSIYIKGKHIENTV